MYRFIIASVIGLILTTGSEASAANRADEIRALIKDMRVAKVDRSDITLSGETRKKVTVVVMLLSEQKHWRLRPKAVFEPREGISLRLVEVQYSNFVNIRDDEGNTHLIPPVSGPEREEFKRRFFSDQTPVTAE